MKRYKRLLAPDVVQPAGNLSMFRRNLLWLEFRKVFQTASHCRRRYTYSSFPISRILCETLLPDWQKESWQTFEETFGHVRPVRVNKWPNSMTDI
jgi:hypothetical protein